MSTSANSNPFGAINSADIDVFEREILAKLPQQYRTYLRDHNGGLPQNRYFNTEENPDVFHELRYLFSLNRGPDYRNLNECWNVASSYDLRRFSEELQNYILIGSTYGGSAVIMHLSSGRICFYEPDHLEPGEGQKIASYFENVADTFVEFIENLISEEAAIELEEE